MAVHVGIIGVGKMGMPVLERLLDEGYSVSCYARSTSAIDAIAKMGAQVCESAKEVASRADVLILCVYSEEQLCELVFEGEGLVSVMKPGSLLLSHTTGSPKTIEALATKTKDYGVDILDAPFSGGPHDILAGEVTLLVGGEASVLSRCQPVLSAYAKPIIHTGPLGSGQKTKLINNLLFGANIRLVVEASRLASEFGLELTTVFEAISHCSGDSTALRLASKLGSVDRLQQSAGPFIAKDLAVAEKVAAGLGVDIGLFKA